MYLHVIQSVEITNFGNVFLSGVRLFVSIYYMNVCAANKLDRMGRIEQASLVLILIVSIDTTFLCVCVENLSNHDDRRYRKSFDI